MKILLREDQNPFDHDNMKRVISLLAVMLVNSCTTYYYISTGVEGDLHVKRKVHAASAVFPFEERKGWDVSVLESGFVVDFYDTSEEMTHVAEKSAMTIDSVSMAGHDCINPLLCPEESLERRFRWFYTYYDYRAVFGSLEDRLPIPFGGYLTDERMELFLKGGPSPDGWNGIEMYLLLDDIVQDFAGWYSDAAYFVMCDIFAPFCTKEQAVFLDSAKERFMEGTEREAWFAMKPDEFGDRLASVAPEAGFGKIYEENHEAMDAAYEEKTGIMDCFETSFIFSVDLPGRYVDGNAVSFIDGNPSWKVDAYRLLYDDFVMEAVARKANIWAFILTFAVIAVILQIFAKVFSKR